ncbi:acyl-CoA dehydrogenase [Achromobacter xylosoxidans]|jgi:alkylation response protein AidB-like acyl-CoA dehydrogenase|uniref:3-sulfinopropanoyl-CoA desulfinase n=2 Tax=Achromobacter TaxID=222 RepID=A0A1R1JZP7_ALCXX|nr:MULTISPECIES: acyl-CoA dehydrogenase family protein [Achromobacter]AZS81001.1 acyl-CoA dehydrogenase [Achromobacter spanius]OFS37264.1 acyl-CoA dehydrogenase [Achromobacter xylosoxidans]OMG92630.1 acyl-CoA dehydrogenase [Achromobacter xylosoxidans]CAB3630233.1 Acyl-CoA dehydrogenase [Achromobacter insuavis]CAB3833640.1 Acyl-CoA dehydrogenase [Achromobacter deleyi]
MNVLQRLDASMPWSPEEAMLLDSVRELARERIAPRAAELDRSGAFPHDNVADINALGLNAMFIPEAYGGSPLSYSCYLACVREISAACASTGIVWATNFHAIKPLIEFGNEEQKQRLLPRIAEGGLASLVITEPSAGSDATGMRTRFEPRGDDIVINGQKTFITNGDVADVYLLFGKWAGIDDAKRAISAVIVEKGAPGLTVVGTEDKMGTRASSTATLAFENCRIPRANLLCEPGDGLRILLTSLNRSRPSVAAHALGIARAAFEDAVAYINERRQFKRRVLEFQGIQFLVADLAAELATCEAWLWRVAGMVDNRADDIGMEASILKLKATDLAMRMSTEAVQLLGGYGYCKDYRVERLMRDAKITQIWEGTNQIHRQLIGRSFLTKE